MPIESDALTAGPTAVTDDALWRTEADERAHDRLTPDAVLDAVAAVDLYVEAFLAGASFAVARVGSQA